MANTPTRDELLAKIQKAQDMVSALCDGRKRWTMSVPADCENDPDIVISNALLSAKSLLCAHQAQAEPAGWRQFINDCAGTAGGMVNGNRLSILANRVLASARPSQAQEPSKPDCGACPGDGSICQSECKLASESPPVSGAVDEREAFEKWIASAMPDLLPLARNFDDYQRVGTQMAWEAWQACAALSRAQQAPAVSEEIHTFLKGCATFAGKEVNGNVLSAAAKGILADLTKPAAAPVSEQTAHVAHTSLLREPISATNPLPPGCYCKPGQCGAPKPSWCRDTAKRDAAQTKEQSQ